MKVGVVTGFVPLPVKHLTAEQYHNLWELTRNAVLDAGAVVVPFHDNIEDMWLWKENPPMVPANPVPMDRYAGPRENALSNIVQHNRTTWALRAAEMRPEVEVWVWLDYGIMKQGVWRNNPITPESVQKFIRRVESTPAPMDYIPFPGIADKGPVYQTGNNWRFCGSTHIWPKHYLPDIDSMYKNTLEKWIYEHKTTPLDLPIWALVEQNSKLPFRWYPAEYDASQLDNYPWGTI
jgi:hypothetical protein